VNIVIDDELASWIETIALEWNMTMDELVSVLLEGFVERYQLAGNIEKKRMLMEIAERRGWVE
jgi:hypothetical protein